MQTYIVLHRPTHIHTHIQWLKCTPLYAVPLIANINVSFKIYKTVAKRLENPIMIDDRIIN